MKNIILFSMVLLMCIATTVVIFFAFSLLDATFINLLFIMLLSIMGYGGATLYYYSYLQNQKQ